MASERNLALKQDVINEIKERVDQAATYVLFDYRGLTDNEIKELRRTLRESGSDYKVYKNTLMARAFNELEVGIDAELVGPSALAFGSDEVAPVKVLSDFAKKHPALALKVGVVDGVVSDEAALKEIASIPSRDGLLTMLAAGLIAIPKDLAISLDLYTKQLEENN